MHKSNSHSEARHAALASSWGFSSRGSYDLFLSVNKTRFSCFHYVAVSCSTLLVGCSLNIQKFSLSIRFVVGFAKLVLRSCLAWPAFYCFAISSSKTAFENLPHVFFTLPQQNKTDRLIITSLSTRATGL